MAYYNSPYNFFPVSYANQMGYSGNMQPMPVIQSPMQMNGMPQQNMMSMEPRCAMTWVGDEAEARGRQIPQGVSMYFMWDSTQQKIYLKTLNQMGLPNPMQVIYYNFGNAQGVLSPGVSGNEQPQQNQQEQSSPQVDMSQYVTKDELNQMRNELRNTMMRGSSSQQSQNYSRNNSSASVNQNGSNNGAGMNTNNGSAARGGNS